MATQPDTYLPTASAASAELKQYIERLERLEEDKKGVADDIKAVMAELKMQGYDPKIVRKVMKIRQMNANDRAEEEAVLQAYLAALGMA